MCNKHRYKFYGQVVYPPWVDGNQRLDYRVLLRQYTCINCGYEGGKQLVLSEPKQTKGLIMDNPNHNPARLVIAGAMYWDEENQTYFRPIFTGEVTAAEGHIYKPYEGDEPPVPEYSWVDVDTYTEPDGDKGTYYYDGLGTDVVMTRSLYLQDNVYTWGESGSIRIGVGSMAIGVHGA